MRDRRQCRFPHEAVRGRRVEHRAPTYPWSEDDLPDTAIIPTAHSTLEVRVTNRSAGMWWLAGPDPGVPLAIFPVFFLNMWETELFTHSVGLLIRSDAVDQEFSLIPDEFLLVAKLQAKEVDLRPHEARIARSGGEPQPLDPSEKATLAAGRSFELVLLFPGPGQPAPRRLEFRLGRLYSDEDPVALPTLRFSIDSDLLVRSTRE